MKRILALCAVAATVVGVTAAQSAVVQNDVQSVPFFVNVPCANGGAGELITGNIDLHILITLTINGNNFSMKTHFQPQGGSLVGTVTGDTYRAVGVSQDHFKGSLQNLQQTFTAVNNFRMIGPGPNNNLQVHQLTHYTVNANGVVTVVHSTSSVDCN